MQWLKQIHDLEYCFPEHDRWKDNDLITAINNGIEIETDNDILKGYILYETSNSHLNIPYQLINSSFIPPNDSIYIVSLAVNESYRRQNIASKLIEKLINKNKIIWLHVLFYNKSAIKLYIKHNFRIIGNEKCYFIMIRNINTH